MKTVELGEIINVHGVHGEIKVNPYADGPEFFKNFKALIIDNTRYEMKSVKITKGCAVLKLEGVDSVEDAQKLRNKTVFVPEDELPSQPEGTYYVKDLEGMEVYADGQLLGILTEVIFTGANDVYAVKNACGKEYLIPAVKQFIKSTDVKEKRMDITHIRGITYDED
ncbi:MAG: ribosome maturation factor RimM [Bacillota bacterium]|nr:ribosome maturation factor RimM [Bacillota bacterium]